MKHYSIDVKSIQLEKKLLRIYAALHNERIAFAGYAVKSMNSIQRWNGNDSVRSRAISLARVLKTYADKPLVSMEKLVEKYGIENAVEIAETMLEQLHSIRAECKHTWDRLIASAMRSKVFSIRSIRATVRNIVRRVVNHFRTPRTHRNRRMRVAFSSAGSGDDDAGPVADGADVPGLTGFSLASGGARA